MKSQLRIITRNNRGQVIKSETPLQFLIRNILFRPVSTMADEIERLNKKIRRQEKKAAQMRTLQSKWWERGWEAGFEIGRIVETAEKIKAAP